MVIDPSRGAVLDLLMQVPDVGERIRQGRLVGYIIIALALIGILVVLERAWQLSVIGRRIKSQLDNSMPNPGNPLGRVMAVYQDNKGIDTETLEQEATLFPVRRSIPDFGLVAGPATQLFTPL